MMFATGARAAPCRPERAEPGGVALGGPGGVGGAPSSAIGASGVAMCWG